MQRDWIFVLLAVITVVLSGCGGTASGSSGEQLDLPVRAVATTGMVADVVRNVGGESVGVTVLMGPGVDPHLYKASEGDVIRVAESDIIFYSGLHLEARLTELFEQMDRRGQPAVAIAEGIPTDQLLAPAEFAGFYDPHTWMDVKLWMHTIGPVRDALIELDPENAESYRSNAEGYLDRLESLEQYVQARVSELPAERRVLVTAHDAFNYFARGYAFEVFAPQGISTETEAGVEDIRRTIDVLVERDVPSLFIESTISSDIVDAVREGARARGHEVTIGGELYTDAMGDEGTPEGTYEGMIRHNIDTIVNALASR